MLIVILILYKLAIFVKLDKKGHIKGEEQKSFSGPADIVYSVRSAFVEGF